MTMWHLSRTCDIFMFVPVLLSTARRSWREVHICRLFWSETIQIKKWCGFYHAGVLFVCLFICLVCQCLLIWVRIEPCLSYLPFSANLLILSLTYPPYLFPSFLCFSSSTPFPLQAIHTTLVKHYNDTLDFVLAVNATKPVPITVVRVSLAVVMWTWCIFTYNIYSCCRIYHLHFYSLMHTNNCTYTDHTQHTYTQNDTHHMQYL